MKKLVLEFQIQLSDVLGNRQGVRFMKLRMTLNVQMFQTLIQVFVCQCKSYVNMINQQRHANQL